MTPTEGRDALAALAAGLSPMYATMASMMIAQLPDAEAARLGAAVTRYLNIAREHGMDAAIACATYDYPEIAPYLTGVDVEAAYAALGSTS